MYAVKVATDARLLKRSCESLLGICSGLMADGELNDREINFLHTWLLEHHEMASSWPGEVVYTRTSEVLKDGVISDEERENLVSTLNQLLGGSFIDDGAVPSGATTLPVDETVSVQIGGQSFCFTGKFLFGTRSACERAVIARGGIALGAVTRDLSYLVIGELSSREWKYSSFGTKIDRAVELRANGSGIQIVGEGQWVSALR
jgi:NAD-dependent DNA ligase